MPNVVLDASCLVGALLKQDSVPERAPYLARVNDRICLSASVEAEIREVFARPKFQKYLRSGRAERILELITAAAVIVDPVETVTDCRDAKDNKYLELALAADAGTIISSDGDLLALDPWREIRIITPAEYIRRFEPIADRSEDTPR
jgi:putative PIN family toxin of toxin-antitoxin system